ncbi:MAG: hypothetical protein JSS76_05960 [Bacteroidetes bacterium]|nr:hypothetical protein [Bacteroidota bacterium]
MTVTYNKRDYSTELFYLALGITICVCCGGILAGIAAATLYVLIRHMLPRAKAISVTLDQLDITWSSFMIPYHEPIAIADLKVYTSKRRFSMRSATSKKYIVIYRMTQKVCELKEGEDG